MATKSPVHTDPIHTELIDSLTDILQSLRRNPPNNLSFLKPLLPAFRITRHAIRNYGKELPQKELQWCEKLQTIEPPEGSISLRNYSTADATTPDDTSATQHNSITEDVLTTEVTSQDDSSTTDATAQDDSSTTDATAQDDSSTTDATAQDDSSTTDATAQDDSSTTDATAQDDAPAARDTSTTKASSTADATTQDDASIAANRERTRKKIARSLIDDEVITHFKEKDEKFKSWTGDPDIFWSSSGIQEQQRPGTTRTERIKSFYENSVQQKPKIEAQNLIRRLDSAIAYLGYEKEFPRDQYIQLHSVEKFVEKIGILKEQAPKYVEVLSSGRRRLQFCHRLSGKTINTFNYHHNDLNFEDLDYGVLFLGIDDRIWDSPSSKNYTLMKRTADELKLMDITKISEKSGAKVAAKTLLQYRQASIKNGKPPALSDAEKNCRALVSESVPSNTEKNNDMVMAKRTRPESDLNDMRASKRARTEFEPDGTRTSRSASSDVEPNSGDRLHDLARAAELAGQSAAASEATIANSISRLHTMQPNNQFASASEANIANLTSDVHTMQLKNHISSVSEANITNPIYTLHSTQPNDQLLSAPEANIANPISHAHTMQSNNQLPPASEANIANPTSDLHAMQSNNQLPSASDALTQFSYPSYRTQNSLGMQKSSSGVMGDISNELLPEPVEDFFNTMYSFDFFSSLPSDPITQNLFEGPLNNVSGEPVINSQPSF